MAVVSHYNIRRVIDIYGAVQDRDLGAVAKDVEAIVHRHEKQLPRGMFVSLRGQVQTMRSSYISLLGGLAFAIVLVYMLIVVNFQSWLDPFIIITGATGGVGRYRPVSFSHPHHAQRAGT